MESNSTVGIQNDLKQVAAKVQGKKESHKRKKSQRDLVQWAYGVGLRPRDYRVVTK